MYKLNLVQLIHFILNKKGEILLKEIYKINSHYSKNIKFIKVFILFLSLILLQTYIPIFHGNEILMDKLESEGVDLTNYYVAYKKLYQFPDKFEEQLEAKEIHDIYGVIDYKTRNVFRNIPDGEKGYYIESENDTNFKTQKGKELSNLEDGEVGVSEYYAYTNFGSVRKAMGKTIEVPVQYIIYEGLLNEETIANDTLEYKIVSIYRNSGLNKRFLNILSNSDNAEDSNKDFMYSDTLIVNNENFNNLCEEYITFNDENQNLYKKYSIYFDEFDVEKEANLRTRLNLFVDNYMPHFIKSELIHKVLRNSSLSSKTTKFFVTFEFISILTLIVIALGYLVYLQNKYLAKYRKKLYLIGINKRKILLSTIFHEIILIITGLSIWLIFNSLLILIFEMKLVFLQDIFQFNKYILKYIWVPILIYIISISISYLLYGLLKSRKKLINIKPKDGNRPINKRFYRKRILSLNISKYILLTLIALITATSIFIINGGIATMKDIYLNSNVFKYDVYANLKGKIIREITDNAKHSAVLTVNRESLLRHNFQDESEEDKLKSKAMLVNAVMFYGEIHEFFEKPKLGYYPKFTETMKSYIEEYPYLSDWYPENYMEEQGDIPLGFDMLISNSVANRLELKVGSYADIILEETNTNAETIYPISGITNIFSNDMNSVYILPSEERFNMVKPNYLSLFRKDDENNYSIMMVFDDEESRLETIEKLKDYKKTGDVIDLIINDGKVRLNDLGELSTKVSKIMMGVTLFSYFILLSAIYKSKRSDDELSQEKNMNAYYNIGVDNIDFKKSISSLNMSTLIFGIILGVLVYISLSSIISDYIYEIMEVIK